MESLDYPINTVIIWKEVELKIIEQTYLNNLCYGCIFTENNYHKIEPNKRISCCNHPFECLSHKRKDKKHVIFKFIKKLC